MSQTVKVLREMMGDLVRQNTALTAEQHRRYSALDAATECATICEQAGIAFTTGEQEVDNAAKEQPNTAGG